MANASFTYGMLVYIGSVRSLNGPEEHWFVIDADGREIDFGPTSASPAATAGVFSALSVTEDGYELTGAGRPGRAYQAGNFAYDFNALGQLIRITDPALNVQQVALDANGNPTSVLDFSSNRIITFEYDDPALIARVVENGGASVTHLSYADGRLSAVAVKDSAGVTSQQLAIAYTAEGLPYQVTFDNDPATTITFTYDDMGNGVYMANATVAGESTNLNYSAIPGTGAAYRVAKTTAQGGKINYDVNAQGDVFKVTLPILNGGTTAPLYTLGYDGNHDLTSFSNGTSTYSMTYNPRGKLLTFNNNVGGLWQYTYNNGVDLASLTDSVGTVFTLGYTDANRTHTPTTVTDGASQTWNLTLNSFGQTTLVTPPTGSVIGQTQYVFEEDLQSSDYGYLRKITNGAGDTVTFDAYTPLGDVTSVTTTPESGITNTTLYSYDSSQRLTQVQNPDATTVQHNYEGRKLLSTIDEASTEVDYTWCPGCGQLTGISAPLAKSLSWQHNGDRSLIAFQDARTNTTNYTYGNGGELKDATYPDTSKVTYKYDNYGRFNKLVTPRNNTITYSYDTAGRPSGFSFTGASFTTTYRADGLVSQQTDQVGTTAYTYTANRLVQTVTHTYNYLTPQQVLTYTYNPDDTVATLTWTSGGTTIASWTYSYDLAGRLTTVANNFGESTSYTYDGEGKITLQTNSNNTSTAYAYNEARNWPTLITQALNGTTFASYALQYDSGNNTVGNLSQTTELDGSVVSYGYDALYRLASETRTGTNPYSKTYEYDLANNVTTVNGSTFASYDGANKISTLAGGTIAHNTDGSITSVNGAGITSATLAWYYHDKLLSQRSGTGTTYYYFYDGEGKRRKKSTTSAGSSGNTYYIYDGSRLIGEISGSTPSVAYTWGADGLVSERILTGTPKSLWYHYGPQGEARYLTNAAGTIADSYLYTAYGLPVITTGTDPNPHRYGGKVAYYTDGPSGMMLAEQRWYSPNLLRWMSRDPIEYGGGDNLYAYVSANPVIYEDPSGLEYAERLRNQGASAGAVVGAIAGAGGVVVGSGGVLIPAGPAGAVIGAGTGAVVGGAVGQAIGGTIDACLPLSGTKEDTDDTTTDCETLYWDIDIPTCRGVSKHRGKVAGARCYESAMQRKIACEQGRPLPPLAVWNN